MPTNWKPEGYSSVSPYLITNDPLGVIAFLEATLGAEALRRYERPDGSIMHAEVRIDDTVVMIGDPGESVSPVPCHLHVYVPDVDYTFARALQYGATEVQAPSRKGDDPDRRGGVLDSAGNTWWFSTQVGE